MWCFQGYILRQRVHLDEFYDDLWLRSLCFLDVFDTLRYADICFMSLQCMFVGEWLKWFIRLIMLSIAFCLDLLFLMIEIFSFQNWTSGIAVAKVGDHRWLPRWKRIDFSANSIPLVIISSIAFISVMFGIVRVLDSIFSFIFFLREMMLFVVIYFSNLVLYIRTESSFLVVRRRDNGSITGVNGSRRNLLSWILR